jgi:hypothetical protein
MARDVRIGAHIELQLREFSLELQNGLAIGHPPRLKEIICDWVGAGGR